MEDQVSGETGERLARLLSAWAAYLRTGRTDELAAMLDEGVVWQGLLPELVCNGRDQVLDMMVRNRGGAPRLTHIEAEEAGRQVAVSVEGPDFPDNGLLAAAAPRSLVFTFSGPRVVHIQSTSSRDAAFALLDR
jgi:hypothetical protein